MNSAERIEAINKKLLKHRDPNARTMDVWAQVFGVDASHPHAEDWIGALQFGLRAELDSTRSRLVAQGVPLDLLSPAFERLRSTASPGHLYGTWGAHISELKEPVCTKVFQWASWALQEGDEADMDAGQLQGLLDQVVELQESIEHSDAPDALRAFLLNQIEEILEAIRMYPVRGMQPLRSAVESVAGSYALIDTKVIDEVKDASAENKSFVARTVEAVNKAAEFCGSAEKLKDTFMALVKTAPAIGKFVVELLKTTS